MQSNIKDFVWNYFEHLPKTTSFMQLKKVLQKSEGLQKYGFGVTPKASLGVLGVGVMPQASLGVLDVAVMPPWPACAPVNAPAAVRSPLRLWPCADP